MGTLLQWSLLAQAQLLPPGAVLIVEISLHVSLYKLHGCNCLKQNRMHGKKGRENRILMYAGHSMTNAGLEMCNVMSFFVLLVLYPDETPRLVCEASNRNFIE